MSELPRTDDLPRAEDGYDAARVEEAFSSFAARVHDLEEVAAELRDELRSLRSEREVRYDEEDWPDAGYADVSPAPAWIASVPPPFARPFAVPRLALEAAFLLAVALLAGLADLTAPWIVLVMAVAWALVALSEWSAAAKRARWRLDEVAPSLAAGSADAETTGPWSMPVVESTAIEPADDSESRTVIATLPALAADEEEPEPRPKRRLLRLRRADSPPVDLPQADPPRADPLQADPSQAD